MRLLKYEDSKIADFFYISQ